MSQYFTFIMTNKNHTVLYTGMTNDIIRRVLEHNPKIHKNMIVIEKQ
jgi:putative endonuclease